MKNKFSIALSLAVIVSMLLTSLALADAATNQSININGGAANTDSLSVMVDVSVLHCPPGGDMQALEVAFRNDPSEAWTVVHAANTPWPGNNSDPDGCIGGSGTTLAYPASFAWELASGADGSRTVHARFKHATDEVFAEDSINFTAPPSDTTPPVITPNVSGTLGNNGWYVSDVTVSWSVEDEESTITSTDGCDETLIDYDTTGVTLTCEATSAGGTSSKSVTIKRDATAPIINAALDKSPAASGWFNIATGAPTVSFTCSDATSGLAGDCPASHLFDEGADQAYSQSISDMAGNSASAGVTNVDVDLTAPGITITTPANGASYLLNQTVAANYGCTDGTSSVATCAGPVANGANIDTSVGSKNFTVNASDVAGNTSSLTNSYTVSYKICALYDQSKSHKKGSTVPIKLQLCDVDGVNFSSASVVVHAASVAKLDNSASGILDDSGYANSPDYDFRYDVSLAGYIFNLSTKPLSTGTWKLTFTVDGASATSYFVKFDVK